MKQAEAEQVAQEIRKIFPAAFPLVVDATCQEDNPRWIVGVYHHHMLGVGEGELFTLDSCFEWDELQRQLDVLGLLPTPGEECYVFSIMEPEKAMALLELEAQ